MRLALFDVRVEKRVAKYKVLEKIVCRLVANVSVLRLEGALPERVDGERRSSSKSREGCRRTTRVSRCVDVLPWSRDLRNGCVYE